MFVCQPRVKFCLTTTSLPVLMISTIKDNCAYYLLRVVKILEQEDNSAPRCFIGCFRHHFFFSIGRDCKVECGIECVEKRRAVSIHIIRTG